MNYVELIWKDLFNFRQWSKKELTWLGVALVIVAIGSIRSSALEFIAALTNVLCVIYVAKGRVSNYLWGLIGVLAYSVVAYDAQLYANFILNIIFIPLQFIGVYYWKKDLEKTDNADVRVRSLDWPGFAIYVGLGALAWCVVSWLLSNYTNDPSPILDSFCLVGSLVAMILMINRHSLQWLLWIVINIVSIYIWVIPALDQPGAWAQVAQWSVLLINSLYGAYKWHWVRINK